MSQRAIRPRFLILAALLASAGAARAEMVGMNLTVRDPMRTGIYGSGGINSVSLSASNISGATLTAPINYRGMTLPQGISFVDGSTNSGTFSCNAPVTPRDVVCVRDTNWTTALFSAALSFNVDVAANFSSARRDRVHRHPTLGLAGIGGALLYSRRASAAGLPAPASAPDAEAAPAIELAPIPKPGEVAGDLLSNWGETPVDLRALFMTMEEVSRIAGSSRIFAIIGYRESRFVTTAHNGNAMGEQDERDSSRRTYDNNKGRNPPLKYGKQAADFGSGGLFGELAPYFLWTGVPEVGKKAPLLNAPPELLFQPRAAAFGAAVYMQRLLANYRISPMTFLCR